MPARVGAADVTAIIDTTLTEPQVDAFIEAAHQIVEHNLSGSSLSTKLLVEIERYIAAHLITLRDPRVSSEGADGLSFRYQGTTGEGLRASHYGQTAITLDPTGTLAALDDKDRQGFLARITTEIDFERDTSTS
jgi:hypothetical protein